MRLTVLQDQRALQRAARPFAGRERVSLAGFERIVIAPAVEDETKIAHHYTVAKGAVQARCKRDHVARAVDDCDVACVTVMISEIARSYFQRIRIKRGGVAGKLLGCAGTKRQRGARLIDQCPALRGV